MKFDKKVLRVSVLPAALLAFAMATPASAQYYRYDSPPPSFGGRIHPQEIDAQVRSMGFQPVAAPRPRGPLWVTHAVDRDGNHVRVLIDSYSGRVIDVLRPRTAAVTPPAPVPFPQQGDPRWQQHPPQAYLPDSDYDDDDADDDYDDLPRNQQPVYPQGPQHQPQVRPQQGPAVIPYEPRSDYRPHAPKSNTAKKKETKKNDTTAAVTPEKEKQPPSPKARPADAPKSKAETKTKTETKAEAPKSAQSVPMPATDTQRAPEPPTTGATKDVPTFEAPKK